MHTTSQFNYEKWFSLGSFGWLWLVILLYAPTLMSFQLILFFNFCFVFLFKLTSQFNSILTIMLIHSKHFTVFFLSLFLCIVTRDNVYRVSLRANEMPWREALIRICFFLFIFSWYAYIRLMNRIFEQFRSRLLAIPHKSESCFSASAPNRTSPFSIEAYFEQVWRGIVWWSFRCVFPLRTKT